jgi:hypothetical protein
MKKGQKLDKRPAESPVFRHKPLSTAVMQLILSHQEKIVLPRKAQVAHRLARALIQRGIEGDIAAIREIFDRTEGKALANVTVNHSGAIASISVTLSDHLAWLKGITGGGESGKLCSEDAIPLPERSLLSEPVCSE